MCLLICYLEEKNKQSTHISKQRDKINKNDGFNSLDSFKLYGNFTCKAASSGTRQELKYDFKVAWVMMVALFVKQKPGRNTKVLR